MIQLNYNIENELDEYELIAKSKHQPSQNNLLRLKSSVNLRYQKYLNEFNLIHKLPDNRFSKENSLELNNAYSNPTGALDELKKRIIDCQNEVYKFICPYCLIDNHSTFDHYIPKNEHPSFSILPKNLIPCCDVCNNKKKEYWKEDDERAIIHFYNDPINSHRFLYCNLTFNNNLPIANFYITFPTGINGRLRLIIEKHFERLDLINRYNKNAASVFSEVETDLIAVRRAVVTMDQIAVFLTAKANELFQNSGRNYWTAIIYQEIASNRAIILNFLP